MNVDEAYEAEVRARRKFIEKLIIIKWSTVTVLIIIVSVSLVLKSCIA